MQKASNATSKAIDITTHIRSIQATLLRVAWALNSPEPEDLVGDILVKLLSIESEGKLPEFNSTAELLAFSRTAIRNLARDRARHFRPDIEIGFPNDLYRTSNELVQEDVIESGLAPRQRLSVVLRNRLGCSYEMIASLLEHSSPSAAQRFHSRSLDALRGCAVQGHS